MFPYGPGDSELGDIEVVAGDDGRLHLFHLTLPNHDVVQHAVSDDGLAWTPVAPALRTGAPGDCDDDQIWTMSVTRLPDGWGMLYTALSRADDGRVQRTGLAVSRDLMTWRKAEPALVAAADPRWYETDPEEWGSVSWRDPKPLAFDGRWYATVAARERSGPLMRRGCAGLLESDDFRDWRALPPLFAPRAYWDLECPQAFELGGRWHLTAATMEDRRQRYWSADSPFGAWRVPDDGGVLAPAGHYAGRVARWRDRDWLWCWHQPRLAEGWQTTPRTIDWLTPRNPFGKHLAPPLELVVREDGTLARRSFDGWERQRAAPMAPAAPAVESLFRGTPAEGWALDAGGGMDVLAAAESESSFACEMDLALNAARGGIALRLDDEGGGWFLELSPGAPEAVLVKWLPETDPRNGRRGYRREELQRERMRRAPEAGRPLRIALVACGPYLEASVDGEVVVATFSGERLAGRWGVWAESGSVAAGNVRVAPLRVPGDNVG